MTRVAFKIRCAKCGKNLEVADTAANPRGGSVDFFVEQCNSEKCEEENRQKYLQKELDQFKEKLEEAIDGG